MSLAVFFSRILGLVREQIMAALFGASTAMDAFIVAFRIPNLLRDLFAEGALSAAFVTVFSSYDQTRSPQETWRLVNNILAAITVIVSLIVILGMVFSRDLVQAMAPNFVEIPGKLALTRELTIIMFPFLLTVSISALLMGILNTRGFFFVPAMASTCFNLTSILIGGGLALVFPVWGQPAIVGMAAGTLLGGLAQLGVQWPLLRRQGFRLRPCLDLSDPGLRRIGRLVVPAIVGLSATQINIFINTNFASRCAEGSVAWLNYAFRLLQFPIGLFGVALSVATLPVIARQAAAKNSRAMGDTLVSSLTLALAMTVPAAVGLWVLAGPVVRLIFEHGRFTPWDTVMTAEAVKFYAVGLFAYGAVKITVPVFYALNDTRWPVAGSFLAVGANVCLIVLTMDILQHRAIALSTSVSMIMNFLLLAAVLYRKLHGYPVARLLVSSAKILLAAGIMGWTVARFGPGFPEGLSMKEDALRVLVSIGLGAVVYASAVSVMGVYELRQIASRGWRRIRSLRRPPSV